MTEFKFIRMNGRPSDDEIQLEQAFQLKRLNDILEKGIVVKK